MSVLYKVIIIETIESVVYVESDSKEKVSDAALELLYEGFVERDYNNGMDLYDVVTLVVDPENKRVFDDLCFRIETNTEKKNTVTSVYSKNSTDELFNF